ncbi:MAG TPA: secretin N-terminal domain-containing protein [Pirellulaceae bacterium]|nr:secretin N-terminal domain-containing protein [Pirellulaceae bacterium]
MIALRRNEFHRWAASGAACLWLAAIAWGQAPGGPAPLPRPAGPFPQPPAQASFAQPGVIPASAVGQIPLQATLPVQVPFPMQAAPPSGVMLTSAAPPAPPTPRLVTQSWQLRNLNWREFENGLNRTWGTRLESSQDPAGDMGTFRFPERPAGSASFMVDHRNNHVTITSPIQTAASWLRLAQVMDTRPQAGDERTAVASLDKADPRTVQKALALFQRGARPARSANHPGRRKEHIGEFVSMLFQQGAGGAQPGFQPVPGFQPPLPGFQPPGADVQGDFLQVAPTPADTGVAGALQRLAGNVQIEILDDIVIVRGRREDVEKVMQLIEQIEQQSIEFRPEVEIYYLKNIDSQQLNLVIEQVYATVFARQGLVTRVPLVDPNAILLIGRKENIPAVVELIDKLDKPLPPTSQFKVFLLKYMSCIDAERTVKQFFSADPMASNLPVPRNGTGIRPYVIAEFRANALIVQAGPRDMAEVERLIASLDIDTTPAPGEVRVFKLKNSLAETLAPVLLEAIAGIGGAQQQQQQQPQAQQGGTSPARATERATSLQFLIPGGNELIRSGVLRDMRITADIGSNSLIVVGPPSGMPLMEAIINQLDGLPPTEAQIKVFSIVNGDATALSTMLQTLFGQAQQGAQGQQGLNQSPTGAGESALVPLRFSVDQRTNTIIATGNPADLEVVRNIILFLDVSGQTERINTVIRLHNAPALDVATAITNLLAQQRTLNQAAPELVTPYQQIEREILVEPELVTNSLIVSATPRYFERLQAIIKELDKRPPMVTIQVLIAEVTLNDDEQFGVEWGLQDSLLFDRGIPPAAGAALQPGFAFNSIILPNQNSPQSLATRENVAGQALSNLALGRIDPTLGFGGLVLTASNESVNVLLRALERSQRLQVISRPQVQTLDNQLAYVNVGALVPRITGIAQNQVGITNPQLEDISVGIILEVTPRTSPDGTIVMQVNATKSSVGPDATGIPVFTDANGNVVRSPQIPLTTAQTTVSAKSGQTVILGGLITKSLTESTRRVPYLADIPVLGRLFRFDTVSNQRTELLIILTPYMMQSAEQNEWLNQRESERMSWCLADIVNIHGPVAMSGNPAYNMHSSEFIFPDLTPAGPQPTPATQPPLDPLMPGGTGPQPYYAPPAANPPSATPPPPAPMLTPPMLPPPGQQPSSVIVPPPAGLTPLPPGEQQAFGDAAPAEPGFVPPPPLKGLPPSPDQRPLTPQTLQPAVPPAGTQAALRQRQAAQQQFVVPANYQQPVVR